MIKKLSVSSFLMFVYATQAYAGGSGGHGSTHGDGHGEASGGLPQLDPSSYTSQIFWLAIIFFAIYVFFSRKSLPEISVTIENRAETIKNDLDSAERLKEEVASVQESYEESLKKARQEASQLFTDVEAEIKAKSEEHSKSFIEHSAKKVTELEADIEKARIAAMEDMNKIAADVATEAAEKIIGVRTDEKSAIAVVNSLNKAA